MRGSGVAEEEQEGGRPSSSCKKVIRWHDNPLTRVALHICALHPSVHPLSHQLDDIGYAEDKGNF